jgi:4-carboxymuconolactone decarboxylase
VAALIANGSTEQLVGHLRRVLDNGMTESELKEVITHQALYAGWPRAMSTIGVAKQVFALLKRLRNERSRHAQQRP